jgi:hypothetical protein
MDSQKYNYRRGGWFLIAATVVAIVLASALHAPIAALIAIGTVGFGGGIVLVALGDRREG